jgi:DHA1 family bicyclomycin/chloramphenicol resistance-like MFS transporter
MEKTVSIPHPGLGYRQFVALIAALMATNALGTDAMLPALGQIGVDLHIAHPNAGQWIITSYILSSGVAQILYGTLADRYGRKPVLCASLVLYVLASLAAATAGSFSFMLLARVLMGLAAAGPRVLAVSIVRDCYAGRSMARVMSFVFLVFLAVPVLAPSLGQIVLLAAEWRAIFIGFALFGGVVLVWVVTRLAETLHPEDRRPIEVSQILAASRFTVSNRVSLGYTLAIMVLMGCLFGFINSSQQVFTVVFRHPLLFPACFAFIAAFMAVSALVNARIVSQFGSRLISHIALLGFIGFAGLHLAVVLSGHETLWTFVGLQAPMMFCFGMLNSNFAAMAMEPMGHIAGSAASIQGFISIVGASLIGAVIGQCFNGTIVPLSVGFLAGGLLALAAALGAENGRLFQARMVVS